MYTMPIPTQTQVEGGGNGGGGGSSGGFATIKGAEYFVDSDPGEGNGTAFQAQDGAFDSEVESILPKDLNVTGLAVGPHLVGVRYKDNNNTWGEVLYQTIHVYDANPSGSGSGDPGGGSGGASGGFASISAAEYFVDTDPGRRKWHRFQAKDGAFDSEVESILPKDLNVTGLSVGPHLVGVRYKDNNNTWGEVLYQTIHVYDANPSGSGSGGPGVVEVVVHPVGLHRFQPRNILSILTREQAAELHFRHRTGRLIPRSNPSCPRI